MNSFALTPYGQNFCTDEDQPIKLPFDRELSMQVVTIISIGAIIYLMPYIIKFQLEGLYNSGKILFSPNRKELIIPSLISLGARTTLFTCSVTLLLSVGFTAVLIVTGNDR